MQKSGLYETPPRRQFKDYFCYFPIWLIYTIFSGVVDIFKYHWADNKRGGKLPSASDRVNFVMTTIIYSSFPLLFLAPRFWEPRVRPQPGSIVFDYRT